MTYISTRKNGALGVGNGLIYLLIGGGIGAAVGLLFAPKSGVELRGDLSDIAHKSYDETLELAHKLKEQSNDLYHAIRERADNVYGFAASKFAEAKDAVDDTAKSAKDSVDRVLQLAEDASAKTPKTAPREPTRIL